MGRFATLSIAVLVGLGADVALGQVVQLPSYHQFSVNTTVSVPDRGMASLGGVDRARSGQSQFGSPLFPLGNRVSGGALGGQGVGVTATIHDFTAMDEMLLTPPESPAAPTAHARPKDSPLPSVAVLREQFAREQVARQREATDLARRAWQAEHEGKIAVARVLYQSAARRASGELKGKILARLEPLQSKAKTTY